MSQDRGFTLTELLVATAVLAVVGGLLAAIVVQFYQVTSQSTARLALLRDQAQAAEALGRDVNSAAVAAIVDDTHLILTVPDPMGGPASSVAYTVAPPTLVRSDQHGETIVARHVASGTAFSPRGTAMGMMPVTILLVSRVGVEEQTAALHLALRPAP